MSYKQFVRWMISVIVIIISSNHWDLSKHEENPHKGTVSEAVFASVMADRDLRISENKTDIRAVKVDLETIKQQLIVILTKMENAKTKTP